MMGHDARERMKTNREMSAAQVGEMRVGEVMKMRCREVQKN